MNQKDSIVEGGRGAQSSLLQLTFISGEDVWIGNEKKHDNPQVGSHSPDSTIQHLVSAMRCECLALR
jgi:hypothetical protein